ncbi:MAG: hypothetical protein JSV36_09545 [Anaerolineae bacterium]|nr:MAG: hypothetical protein JSV36_09545 [Anaerolineae bacterium]
MSEERMQILRMIEEAQITPEEGIELLEALNASGAKASGQATVQEEGDVDASPPVAEPLPSGTELLEEGAAEHDESAEFVSFGRLWLIPLGAGVVVGAVSLGIVAFIQAISPGSFFLVCGLMPLLLGLAVILLALWSRTARWLHVRIRGEQHISLSFPLPLRLTGWILRLVRPFVPQLEETGLDEVILSLDENLGEEEYFHVDVQDDQDGERIQVYIG